ncbi:hypothetical protein chiPu_0023273 [Chiloscyllium punctatum]|uniref:Uncharacterized protein n=1 Tax=Chiloscyllium punctatum TaxID=137246 RepID=A0A401T994_CHIPU|nr:hypothetical protein [Chiloscyllium punctatum]
MGSRCEHADLLAVVATQQKQQALTTLLVVSIIASALLIAACVLLHCCQKWRKSELCQQIFARREASLLKNVPPSAQGDTGKEMTGHKASLPVCLHSPEPMRHLSPPWSEAGTPGLQSGHLQYRSATLSQCPVGW